MLTAAVCAPPALIALSRMAADLAYEAGGHARELADGAVAVARRQQRCCSFAT